MAVTSKIDRKVRLAAQRTSSEALHTWLGLRHPAGLAKVYSLRLSTSCNCCQLLSCLCCSHSCLAIEAVPDTASIESVDARLTSWHHALSSPCLRCSTADSWRLAAFADSPSVVMVTVVSYRLVDHRRPGSRHSVKHLTEMPSISIKLLKLTYSLTINFE